MAARSSFLKSKKDLNVHAAVGKSSSTATCCVRDPCAFPSSWQTSQRTPCHGCAATSLCPPVPLHWHALNFAAVSRVDRKPKCSGILNGVKCRYICQWPHSTSIPIDLHLELLLLPLGLVKNCRRLRGSLGQGTDRSSAHHSGVTEPGGPVPDLAWAIPENLR